MTNELYNAVMGWWEEKRPVRWTLENHKKQPYVNLTSDTEKNVVDKLLKTMSPVADTRLNRKRTFKGSIYIAEIGGLRKTERSYREEFFVEANSREEAMAKIKEAGLRFLVKHDKLQVQDFIETTP